MALIRLLYFCTCSYNINVCVIHVPGVCNEIADSLSRFQMERFRKFAPRANIHPDSIPVWPTQSFITASYNAGIMVLPSPQDEHISVRISQIPVLLQPVLSHIIPDIISVTSVFLC